jgi:hypothetical protein
VAGIALIWLTYLTIVQLFSVTRRDPKSYLPVPPRKVQGNGAWPVLGHTPLFVKTGGDMALLFPPEWRIWKWNPWSRQIGDCFSVFIWGQWRVVVKGPEKTKKVIEETELDQGWAWSAPVTLLGQHCLALLDDEHEAGSLRRMIEGPLNQDWVVKQAPQFAEMAQKCLDEIVNGKFRGGECTGRDMNDSGHGGGGSRRETTTKKGKSAHTIIERCDSSSSDGGDSKVFHRIKWDALRSYTFDLIDGPVLRLNMFHERPTSSASTPSFRADGKDEASGPAVRFNSTPIDEETPEEGSRNRCKKSKESRDKMMLWMERLKDGLTEVKFTLGKEWMQCWRCNWYGRAVNARDHLEAIVGAHVEKRDKLVPVHHEQGHSIRDPFANTLPLVSLE